MESKHSAAIIEAFEKGYRADGFGKIMLGDSLVNVSTSANGYEMFSFKSKTIGWQRISVSKFVAFQKFGKAALGEFVEARHINGDCADNRASNIEIGTPSENAHDISKDVRIARALKAAAAQRKLSIEQAASLKKDYDNGKSLKVLSIKYGISKTAASYIVNGKTYQKGGDPVIVSQCLRCMAAFKVFDDGKSEVKISHGYCKDCGPIVIAETARMMAEMDMAADHRAA